MKKLAESKKSFELKSNVVLYEVIPEIKAAWITLNSPQTANALDDNVFDALEDAFAKANADEN